MIPKHIIDDIMATARIEEVIGEFVALKKSGADLKALSPFSQEKTPSFYVSPNKQIFKDFSSGKGGNVVTFLMEHEQCSYPDALRYLAKKYGITIPEEKEITPEELLQANEKESLFIVLQYALEFYRKQLEETEDGKALGKSYFLERGFREETLEKFGLGYAPNSWDQFGSEALKLGYKAEYLELAGLSKVNEQGKRYDMFRNRVIFPIHNLVGKVVAFAGRQLSKDDKGPKYLNSPETPVYHKSDILYGMFFAKNSIRIKDKCFLVEGYTDVITLHQAGIENVVASSGTSLTDGQIRQVRRFTPNITVLYDGDPAGLKASQRGIDLILAQGMNVRLVIFPDGEDPDSYCKKVGGQAFETYIEEHEQDFILFKSQLLFGETGKDPLKKAEAVKSIVASIALIPDPVTRTIFAQECAKIMEVPEQVIAAELGKARRKEVEDSSRKALEAAEIAEQMLPDEEIVLSHLTETEKQERQVMKLVIRHAADPFDEERNVAQFVLDEIHEGLEFTNPLCANLLEEVRKALSEGHVIDATYFVNHPETSVNSFAADALQDKYRASDRWQEMHEIPLIHEEDNYKLDLHSAILHYKIRKVEMVIEANLKELKEAVEEEKITELMEKQNHLMSMRRALSELIGATIIK
ncbi:MAG TPA: DNA primase [Bacteroidetes bacterium]|nr:DNA primase [Bacteroidota bacterium]